MSQENLKVVVQNSGLNFTGVLLLIFITLKLTGHIQWSWWWVFSPVWIPLALVVFLFLIFFILFVFWDYSVFERKR